MLITVINVLTETLTERFYLIGPIGLFNPIAPTKPKYTEVHEILHSAILPLKLPKLLIQTIPRALASSRNASFSAF